jgi:hypothetical protein
MNQSLQQKHRIQWVLGIFMAGLVLSGLTAFPLLHEINWLASFVTPGQSTHLSQWILRVQKGVQDIHEKYPFLAYGTDWLAFAHIIIALFFIGPLMDPVRNIWVIKAGMVACFLVLPTAMICGAIRGIPFYWRLIDCSFGVFGFIPLRLVFKWTREIQSREGNQNA